MGYEVVVPKLSEITSLYNNVKFSYQQINANTIFLNSNVNYTYCSGTYCMTQLQNMVTAKDLKQYGGIVVDLAMTYTQLLAYKNGNQYILYGTGGMNYGIFRCDLESGTMVANSANFQKQFYCSNGDKLYVRYVARKQADRDRLKIDVIRNGSIFASGDLVYSHPVNVPPVLGYGYGFSTGSSAEKMINPPNVVGRNLTLVRADSPLLKENMEASDITQLLKLHNEAIQRGIPIEDPVIVPRENDGKVGFLTTSYQNLCGTQTNNLTKNVSIQAIVGEGLTLYTGCPVTMQTSSNGEVKITGIATESSQVNGFVLNSTNRICNDNQVGIHYEGQIVSVAPLGCGIEMFLPCYDDLEDSFVTTPIRLFNGKLTQDDNRGNPTLPIKLIGGVIDAESFYIENGEIGIENTKAIKVRL